MSALLGPTAAACRNNGVGSSGVARRATPGTPEVIAGDRMLTLRMARTEASGLVRGEALHTEKLDRSEEVSEVRRASLRVASGEDEGAVFGTGARRCVIGTHPTADVRLHDRTVSRFHCELVMTPTEIVLCDLQSRNGTQIDGVRIERAHLHDGAVITVGSTQLVLSLEDEPHRVPISSATSFGDLVGISVPMRRAFALLEQAARSDATVLLTGETGTGKEAAAEALHREGPRSAAPFIVVDCAALTPSLLESELFGHERGAFTGAAGRRTGAFEAAHTGTVFLDEIGELPLDLQPRLLRVLEQRRVRRVGSNDQTAIDVRIVAATNRDLRAEVNARRFRSDLYYRLAVVEIEMPPLRERRQDVPLIAQRMLAKRVADASVLAVLRRPKVIAKLQHDEWPGNVRELRNFLERCLTFEEPAPSDEGGDAQEPALVEVDATASFKVERERWIRSFEGRYLAGVMQAHQGNVSAAARAANLDRVYFYRLLWKHGLR